MSSSSSLLIWFARWEIIALVGGLAVIIATGLLSGSINAQYLLYGTRRDGTKYFSPGRVQLLVVTIAIAFQYLLNASQSGKMPSLPNGSLELLGLSNAFYLGGKAWFSLRETASEQER